MLSVAPELDRWAAVLIKVKETHASYPVRVNCAMSIPRKKIYALFPTPPAVKSHLVSFTRETMS